MADDIREELYEIRERNDREIQRLQVSVPDPVEREQRDAASVVTVRVAADGGVRDIRISHDWRNTVQDSELGGVILETIAQAQAAVAAEYAAALEEQESSPLPPARPAPIPPDDGDAGRGALASPEEAERVMAEVYAEAEAALADVERALDSFGRHTASARSSHGEVIVDINADGDISRFDLDPRWLARAHPANIGRLATETLHRAQTQIDVGLSELDAVVADMQATLSRVGNPYTLSRRLGIQP
ncbi:hypothetical protein BCF74_10120 [Knoellia remsis]|uniref:YbaB/EbfC DNA-binding family protein n=1 Tax=Knoellia remsis TaxID=407159 RepID=A0A2T0V0C5_9MICO|nr:hypothetical protein [Knoellia remsis]PRY63622.1 hypothetical protein BCF74_10120 [Knoellia remsis]